MLPVPPVLPLMPVPLPPTAPLSTGDPLGAPADSELPVDPAPPLALTDPDDSVPVLEPLTLPAPAS
jgi:hypothetical protein